MNLSYPYICANQAEVPKEAVAHIDKEILEGVGGAFTDIFPTFGRVFEHAGRTIDTVWSTPKLVIKKGVREWVSYIVVQCGEKNLFFLLQPEFTEKEGDLFDEDYQMLPASWKEIYRWFNSFCVTEEGYCPMDWWNTPFRYSARLDLDDYEQGSGASSEVTDRFVKSIGCQREKLRCWLLTENADALFVNEEACDGKVFHVNGRNMDVITELHDPRAIMDEYLAHYLSGGKPAEFSFIDCG
ncbi:hypothetical protein [Candidatus Thiodiazotropha sp. CDECU1]|uniref:hypothetical protein n=1 Tax=Candidatus Thiodiazotropha sp. CDECU1 TaxID=3065865 RepID=UPI00292CADE1|nr:hypothetical protein [Candidatus Thiodiazotropha sp. CDECU1]